MVGSIPISLSGLLAQTQRLDASASNVANARTVGSRPGPDGALPANGQAPFTPIETVQQAVTGPGGEGLGTRAFFRPANPAVTAELQPDSPFADAEGLVDAPNVDFAREAVNQVVASRAFRASLAALRVSDDLERETLNIRT